MESLAGVAKDLHVANRKDLEVKIGNDRKLGQNCIRALYVSGAHLHGSHSSVIKVPFHEIGQMIIPACVDLAAKLLGFTAKVTNRAGLLACRIPRRRERSNERKRRLDHDEEHRSPKIPRID